MSQAVLHVHMIKRVCTIKVLGIAGFIILDCGPLQRFVTRQVHHRDERPGQVTPISSVNYGVKSQELHSRLRVTNIYVGLRHGCNLYSKLFFVVTAYTPVDSIQCMSLFFADSSHRLYIALGCFLLRYLDLAGENVASQSGDRLQHHPDLPLLVAYACECLMPVAFSWPSVPSQKFIPSFPPWRSPTQLASPPQAFCAETP